MIDLTEKILIARHRCITEGMLVKRFENVILILYEKDLGKRLACVLTMIYLSLNFMKTNEFREPTQ
jgi:hypothetical protein